MLIICEPLGHTTSSFTRDTYTSVADEARRTAADTLAAFFSHRDTTPPHETSRDTDTPDDGDAATPQAA